MKALLSHAESVLTVSLDGCLDHTAGSSCQHLIDEISPIRVSRVIVDLSRVPRIDSVGLGMLYLVRDAVTGIDARLTLRGATPTVLRLLELTGSHQVFEIE
ncbi:STAS domain-containing protein [Magnetospirillum molischianum]|uniref:Putative anti-anti-sigma regulatory factor n=1 Tax=Magnetospirillum molischianum DSM 120 TaxID=1150626 RepID=H8FTP1_MAGML